MSSAGLPTTPDPIRSPGGLINTPPGMATTPADNATGFSPVSSVPPTNTIAPSTPIPTTSPAGTTPSGSPTLAGPAVYGYNPDAYKVTEDQTVAGQIGKIIASGSPLMRMAETNAKNQMNQRGLINSSQAITAGQAAVYGAATPIATADAATYAKAAENTTTARNTAMHDTAAAQNAGAIAKLQSDTTLTAQDMQDLTNIITTNITTDTQRWLGQLQSNTQLTVAEKGIASNERIAQWNNTSAQVIENIRSNTTLTVDERDNAVKTYIANNDNATRIKLQEMATAGDIAKIDKTGEWNLKVANVEADNRTLIQTSGAASNLWNNFNIKVSEVMSDPNLSTDQKGQILNNMTKTLKAGLDSIAHLVGADLTTNLTFDTVTGGGTSGGGTGNVNPNSAGTIEGQQNNPSYINNPALAPATPATGYSGAVPGNANGQAIGNAANNGGYLQGYNSYGGYNVDASGNVTT